MGEIGENGGIGPVRRKRCRIKGLIKEVIKQLEFYFSEPNLRRDLIFRKLAGNNGTKPVSILQFMKFDKIKELTQDVQIVRRAAFESKVLKLCDISFPFDQSGISRLDPVSPTPRDIKAKTVYIEGLPKDATIQWLQDLIIAVTHNKPAYISLPRQKTGFCVGFAFVEFNSYSLAQNTVKDFNSKKAIATAFLLQSNRRKLFQQSMRRRHLRALEATQQIPLPPPIIRFLPPAERDRRLAEKKPPSPPILAPPPPPAAAVLPAPCAKKKCSKRRRDSENEENLAKRKRRTSSRRDENGRTDEIDQSAKRKVAEIEADDAVVTKSDAKRAKSENVKYNGPEVKATAGRGENARGLKRVRHHSYPPRTGCLIHHGDSFWGTVSGTVLAQSTGLPIRCLGVKEQSTQTESSYCLMSKKLDSLPDRHKMLERSISELVRSGRKKDETSRKRKIPSTIQIAQIKRKRKSRIRKRRNIERKNSRRRTSSLIIPNWGGLRLRAMIATEWSDLKKQYKTLQKQNMRKLKQSLKDVTFLFAGAALRKHIKHDELCANMSDSDDDDNPSATENENDFNQPAPINQPIVDPRGSRRLGQAPNYRHGVIVKIFSEVPLPSPDRLKARFNEYGPVAYVDRTNNQSGYIRFNNQSGAQKSIEKESHFKLELLTGQKEENYWEYLLNQREKKRTSERKKLRGVERLVNKANRQRTKERKIHILFDSDLEAEQDMF